MLYDVLSQGASNLLEAIVIGIQLHFLKKGLMEVVSLASGNTDALQGKALYESSHSGPPLGILKHGCRVGWYYISNHTSPSPWGKNQAHVISFYS